MERFGQYLLRNQLLSQEQLNEALQCQVIFGGRLGTNLVELGYLSLDDLANLLSRRCGVPVAPVEELESLPRETLNAVPRATIDKFKIIPMRIEAKTLHIAVCDPTDVRAMDEIAFATGMRVKPYLLPELRLYYLLEKHYGIKRDIRYIRLGRTLSRGKFAGQMVGAPAAFAGPPPSIVEPTEHEAVPQAHAQAAQKSELEAKGFRPLGAGEELTDENAHEQFVTPNRPPISLVAQAAIPAPQPVAAAEELLPLIEGEHLVPIEDTPAPADAPPPAYAPPTSPQEAAEIRSLLQTATDREEVAKAALRLARAQFAAVALFIVNKDTLLGWHAAGGALDRQSIESLMLPAAAESVLRGPASGTPFQGPVSRSGLNDRLLAGLGRKPPVSAVVLPVQLKNRTVNLFYADNGEQPVSALSAGFLQLLVKDVAAAYERIILAKKRK